MGQDYLSYHSSVVGSHAEAERASDEDMNQILGHLRTGAKPG